MRLFKRSKRSHKRQTHRRILRLEPLETRRLLALDLAAIGGTAYVDATGDGLTADDTLVSGATVELYRDDGDGVFDSSADTLLGSTTTDSSGVYRFASTNAGGSLSANTLTPDDYFVRQLASGSLTPPPPQLVTITNEPDGTTVQTIDTFDTTEQIVTADPTTTSANSSIAATEVIGGERDVLVNFTSGSGEISVEIDRFNSNLFAFQSGLNVVGDATVQYDGADGDATTLDPTGLGGVSLSDTDPNAGLLLATQGDSSGATAEVRVYSNATDYSTTTINIPDQTAVEEIFVPFSDFSVGGGAGADFTSIGAIEVLINGVANLDATVTVLSSLKPNEITVNLENTVPGIEIVKFTNGQDANTATGPMLEVGSTATFSYTVRNVGGSALSSVVVTDDNGTPSDSTDDFNPTFTGGDDNGDNQLDIGETWTYQATHTVTAGQYTNIAVVTAIDGGGAQTSDTDPSNHFGVDAEVTIVKSTNGEDANSPTGPVLAVGSTATFTYVIENTGNVALDSVTVTDDNGTPSDTSDDFNPTYQSGDDNSNGILDVGETWNYQATHTVTAGQYTNTATVTGNPVDSGGADIPSIADATASDPSNHFGATGGINVVKSTNGEDANSPTGPLLPIGSTATFAYVVTNTGNVPLANVSVRDDNGTPSDTTDDFDASYVSGDDNSNGRLDTNETWTYQATHTVTAGQYTNTATATGNPVDESGNDIAGLEDASDTDVSNHFGVTAGIDIVKSTNGDDANSPTGPLLEVGSTATFTYVVTNTGTTSLANVTITDDNGTPSDSTDDFTPTFQGGDSNSDGRLDPSETWTYQATRTVTLGQYTNTATVSANPVDFSGNDIAGMDDVSAADASNHLGFTAAIHIVKATNGDDADTAPGPSIAVGDTATFTYTVTNTGTVALGSVTVTDDNGTSGDATDDFNPTYQSGDTNSNNLLDTTETWVYQATHTVTEGQYTNVGSVTANPVDSQGNDIGGVADVTASNTSNHFGFTAGIAVQKLTNGIDTGTGSGPTLSVGSTVTFTYNVTNTGNIALTNVGVRDDNGTPSNATDDFDATYQSGDTDGDNELDVTETWVFEATKTVTAGSYTNTATASGHDPNSDLVSATDISAHTGVERLSKRRFLASNN